MQGFVQKYRLVAGGRKVHELGDYKAAREFLSGGLQKSCRQRCPELSQAFRESPG
jgi:hypothetical protein